MRLDAALVALVGCAAPAPAPALHNAQPVAHDERCELPWDAREMAQGEVHVLAWKHDVDARPLHVDSAIILVVRNGQFSLVHMYRHRKDGPTPGWHESMIYDAPGFRSSATFDAPPTRQEFDAFLVDTQWVFGPSPGFYLTGKGICVDEWRKYLGGEPWHHFGEIGPLRSRRDPAP